jgi:membrane protein DedA with SNARE-associated domain/rhodanese-related sulfurtransferase
MPTEISHIIQFVARHGYILVFVWVLAEQAALPIPSLPLLLVSGALVRTGGLHLPPLLASALSASVIADNVWFHLGKRYSGRALQFICKISIEQDSCVRRTENVFLRYGLRSLLVSKFIPGLNVVVAPLAGGSGANFGKFLLFDSLGAFIWSSAYISTGYVFSDQLEVAIGYAMRMGSGVFVIALCSFAVWTFWKVIRRRNFMNSINVARITPGELQSMLSAGQDVTIVDLRSSLAAEMMIPGALRIPAEDLPLRHDEIPRDREIVLFCTCPNEASSARAALMLKKYGVTHVRPLQGGAESWKRMYSRVPFPI